MNIKELDKWRVTTGGYGTEKGEPYGAFMIPNKGNKNKAHMCVVASPMDNDVSEEWQHVSVSYPHRCPTWDEMCFVKDLFWSENDLVVQFHPVKKDYINNHKFCLHLWRNHVRDIPTPHWSKVGMK